MLNKVVSQSNTRGVSRLLVSAAALAGAFAFSSAAFAQDCSGAAWSQLDGEGNTLTIGNPAEGVSRFSGVCGAEFTGTGAARTFTPDAISRIVSQFYVLDGLTGSGAVTVYEGYSDDAGNNSVFTLTFDGDNFVLSAGGQSVTVAAGPGWNVVETDVAFDAANGQLSLTVNDANNVFNGNTGAGTVESVAIGMPDGLNGNTGSVTFDDATFTRSTVAARVLNCNAQNSDDVLNVLDALSMLTEINGGGVSAGTPDCNLDGTVNVLDALNLLTIISS